ncbi:hypothetical protein [Stakelama pacifica]|uniref:XRE family transcriptional regulator n=1 Tax=Stakelama pacifica TaxID=517720 RepID=A0A4R6FN40_9SPHN|nr:hypothetical protein [Stakelama pacifica]TDN83019.1 hypothetical protein EV664_105217 [Stakelama pacifica]GGO94915.1 hypothetical protein GCM10011329_17870 [Stakelama pacifica]
MLSPIDKRRRNAFRTWMLAQPGKQDAADALDMSPRALDRFYSGASPVPPGVLRDAADRCDDPVLCAKLRKLAEDRADA